MNGFNIEPLNHLVQFFTVIIALVAVET